MSSPFGRESTPRPDWIDTEAIRHAAGGDLIDWIKAVDKRLERLEAQLNTN